jgi:hypothetical protein
MFATASEMKFLMPSEMKTVTAQSCRSEKNYLRKCKHIAT